MMHVKCTSLYRIVLLVFLCVKIVYSGENSDETTLRSAGETSIDYGTEKTGFSIDSTSNYGTSDASTSSTNGGTLIEDKFLIDTTEGLLNNKIDSVDTPITTDTSNVATITTNENNERLAGTSIYTNSGFKSSTINNIESASNGSIPEEYSTTNSNYHYEGINSSPYVLTTKRNHEISSYMSLPSVSVSENAKEDESVTSTYSTLQEKEQSNTTNNLFEERTQSEIWKNEVSTMQNKESPENQNDTSFEWSTTNSNKEDTDLTTTNNYEQITDTESFVKSLVQNSSPQEDELTLENSPVPDFTSSSKRQENYGVTTVETLKSAREELKSSTETVEKNVSSESDLESTTYVSNVSSKSFGDVFESTEKGGKYTTIGDDTNDIAESTTENFDQTTNPFQGELQGHTETTTSNSEHTISENNSLGQSSTITASETTSSNSEQTSEDDSLGQSFTTTAPETISSNSEQTIFEDGSFGQSSITTVPEDENKESSTSTMTNEYSEITENQTDIIVTTYESTTFDYPTWTSLNLVQSSQSSSESTTEEVTSGANNPSSTGKTEEDTKYSMSEITTLSEDRQTTMMSSFVFPDRLPFDKPSTQSPAVDFLCEDIEMVSHKVTKTGKTDIEVAWTLSHFNSYCEWEINLSCNSTDINFDWIISHQEASTKVDDSKAVSRLENLSEFTNYSCIGQLVLKKEYDDMVLSTSTFEVTTKPDVPSNINFNITDVTAESFLLSWQRPTKIPGNLQMYHVIIKEKKINHYIPRDACKTLTEMSIHFSDESEYITHNFTSGKPDRLYEVQILAQDEAGNSTGTINKISTKSSRSTAPLDVKSKLHNYANHCDGDDYNSTLLLTWELPCDTSGKLLEFEVQISEYISSRTKSGAETIIYNVPKNPNIKNSIYELMVPDLNASCSYEITIAAATEGNYTGFPANHTTKMTSEGCPSEPAGIHIISLTSSTIFVEWQEPEKYFGKIIEYNVIITGSGPKHKIPDYCPEHQPIQINETTKLRNYKFDSALPNYGYKFMVQARTSAGFGNPSQEAEIITKTRESEPVRDLKIKEVSRNITNEIYEYKVSISFARPCNTNGQFKHYVVRIKGTRYGYPNYSYNTELKNDTSLDVTLKNPEFDYTFDVRVVTDNYESIGQTTNIITTAGIPKLDEKKLECAVDEDYPTEINVNIGKEIFGQENGAITHYAIFLFEDVQENLKFGKPSFGICDESCPLVNETYADFKAKTSYLVSSKNWNPFTAENKQVTLTIGNKDCSSNEICQTLSENTNYIVLLRGYTNSTYRDVFYLVKTGTKASNVGFYLVTIIILVVIAVLGVYLYLRRKRYLTIRFRSIPNTPEEPIKRHLVAVKHFKSYYSKTQNDPTILRKQYEEIEDEIKKYKDESVHTTFALKPENKRKNRYTNILPYDEYRVKLQMDEDDEISSDYINASYIRGASGEVEYIATQGPLEHTCKDFWKMVIQENVTVIVMVSQFIEKEKEKCFKYFPNNHENMMICEDLEVKCLTELQFDTHCIRTLLIRKDLKQFSVIHMQYLDWPDFGCPSGTYNMLSFCREVRDRIQIEKGLMAVHCSAGVGRTGTLISLDILLQTMQKKKEISIFECVMELRKQRTHMVQTEKQYVYIYTCLNDVLENCSLYSFDDTKKDDDHIYVNVDEKQRSIKHFRCEEDESAF